MDEKETDRSSSGESSPDEFLLKKAAPKRPSATSRTARPSRVRAKKTETHGSRSCSSGDESGDSDLELSLDSHVNDLLREKAANSKLSVRNVKTILKHVITNEAVLKMVRETLRDEGEWDSGQDDDNEDSSLQFFTPKMTRAKLKELLRHHTPEVKKPQVSAEFADSDAAVSLLVKEFKEDESSSDEEYKPDCHHESDDESRTSISEIGSPGFDTPTTPKSAGLRSQVLLREHVRSQAKGTPGSEGHVTPSTEGCDENAIGDAVNPARKSLEFSPVSSRNEDLPSRLNPFKDVISLRTRSRHPMKDTTVESLELSFVPPDITEDMYETEVDNPDWAEFLRDFVLCPSTVEANDDEEADPEYNVLEEEECVDPYEKLHNNRVRVSKKELNDLMAELFEDECFLNIPDPVPVSGQWNQDVSTTSFHDPVNSMMPSADFQDTSSEADTVEDETPAELTCGDCVRISEHVSRHVQLLTQTFVFGSNLQCMAGMRESCRDMLVEIASAFGTNTSSRHDDTSTGPRQLSALFVAVPNLYPALAEVTSGEQDETKKRKTPRGVRSLRKAANRVGLPWWTAERIVKSKAVLFPAMLPPEVPRCAGGTRKRLEFCFCEGKQRKKIPSFLPSEDKLLAVGLEEFTAKIKKKQIIIPHRSLFADTRARQKYLRDAFILVQRHLMPARPKEQLRLRVKNMASARRAQESNMLSRYLSTGRLEPEPVSVTWLSMDMVLLPPYQLSEESFPHEWHEVVHFAKVQAGLVKNAVMPLSDDEERMECSVSPTPVLHPEPAVDKVTPSLLKRKTSDPLSPSFNVMYILPQPPPWLQECVVGMVHSVEKSGEGGLDERGSNDEARSANTDRSRQRETEVRGEGTDRTIQTSAQQADRGRPSIDLKEIVLQTVATPKSEKYLEIANDSNQASPPTLVADEPKVEIAEAGNPPSPVAAGDAEPEAAGVTSGPVAEADEAAGDSEGANADEEDGKDADGSSKSKATDSDADGPDPLQDLMLASTTIKKPPRKTKKMKDVEASMKLLADEDPEAREQREAQYVSEYLLRLHSTLSGEGKEPLYDQFYELMGDFDDSASLADRITLFNRVESLLEGYPDLTSEFLLFLGDDCAFALGRYEEFSYMLGVREFLRSVNVHFVNQPLHIQKIAKTMQQIATGKEDEITKENVKSAILPLLKGSSHLIDLFTNLLRGDPPPESLFFDSDYEEVNLGGEDSGSSTDETQDEQHEQHPPASPTEGKAPTDIYDFKRPDDPEPTHEEVKVDNDEDDDPYGGSQCPCRCHDSKDPKLKARLRHCVPCGLKFVDGGAYVKVGKSLRPAKISYIYRPQSCVPAASDPPEVDEPMDQDPFVEDATSGSTSPSLTKVLKSSGTSPSFRASRKSTSVPKEYTNMRLATEGGSVSFGASSPDEVPPKPARCSGVTPGKENKLESRKRKADGETQVPAHSSTEEEEVAAGTVPKVKKALDVRPEVIPNKEPAVTQEPSIPEKSAEPPQAEACVPGSASMTTPSDLLQTPAKPFIVGPVVEPPPSVALPDFRNLDLSNFTPAPLEEARPSLVISGSSDVLETPRVEHR